MARYTRRDIDPVLDRVLADTGEDKFCAMKLLELEKLVRTYDPHKLLPAKTVLRAAINAYRTERWPALAPKRVFRRY